MGKISNGTFRDWNNGETMFEADYEKERELLRVAINDNYDRIIKKYEVVDKAGVVKATQNLTTAINYLKFKESDNVVLTLDTTTSTLTIGVVDGSITTAKIQDLAVTTAKLADLNVTTIKIADLAVTRAKIADAAINLQKVDTVSLDTRYYTESEVDAKDANLAGTGRTTETIKGNADALTTHKSSGDHDGRYYTKTLLDGGQLDTRYFTETELSGGALDTRYYTETEVDTKLANTAGGMAYSFNSGTTFPSSPEEGWVFYKTDEDVPYLYQVMSDGTASWRPIQTRLQRERNTVTLTADAINVGIGITSFNKNNDMLWVFKNSTFLQEGQDYNVGADGLSIDKVSGTWVTGDVFDFIIMKTASVTGNLYDGALLQDGSVSGAKLATDIKVGSLATLTTTNKTDVTSALNEIAQQSRIRSFMGV